MAGQIRCAFCGQSLQPGNVPVRCPACGREAALEGQPPLRYTPVLLESGTEVLAPPVPVVPPQPAPLRAVLLDTKQEGDQASGGLQRCPHCGARVTPRQMRCSVCNETLAALELRPWEEPGGLRRDCEPHRGTLLLVLGRLALLLGSVGGLGVFFFPFAFLSTVALALGGATLVLASHDREQIKQKRMDPEGEGNTRSAQTCAHWAVILAALTILLGGMLQLPWLLRMLG